MAVKIKDPETGKEYPSVKALAEAHGCNVCTVYQRLARGDSLEVALARVNLHHTPSRDHTGASFPTIVAMCQHWGIPAACFRSRFVIRGWSLERSLTEPVAPSNAAGHHGSGGSRAVVVNGVRYASIREAAKAHGVNVSTVYARLRHKCTPEQAVRPVSRGTAVVYDGRRFSSKALLAASLGISPNDLDALEGLKYE